MRYFRSTHVHDERKVIFPTFQTANLYSTSGKEKDLEDTRVLAVLNETHKAGTHFHLLSSAEDLVTLWRASSHRPESLNPLLFLLGKIFHKFSKSIIEISGDPANILVNFDVEILFSNVPVDDTPNRVRPPFRHLFH